MTEGKWDTQCISGYINEHCRICNNHVTDNDFKESNFVIDVSGLIVHDRCPQNHAREPMTEEKQITTGLMEWQITGDLLQQFKDAKHKEAFYSPPLMELFGGFSFILAVLNHLRIAPFISNV
eukprot:239422_1